MIRHYLRLALDALDAADVLIAKVGSGAMKDSEIAVARIAELEAALDRECKAAYEEGARALQAEVDLWAERQ
jgi:hypothetical protein